MAKIVSDLIFDIGLYDGDDTAYYLHQGYRVVAVDANPYMIEGGKQRFAAEIKAGRLTLVNHAISTSGGVTRVVGSGYNRTTMRTEAILWTRATPCAADFNGTGGLTVQDIFDFLSAWFAGLPSADFNHVGGITVQDIFDFLGAWFTGCP